MMWFALAVALQGAVGDFRVQFDVETTGGEGSFTVLVPSPHHLWFVESPPSRLTFLQCQRCMRTGHRLVRRVSKSLSPPGSTTTFVRCQSHVMLRWRIQHNQRTDPVNRLLPCDPFLHGAVRAER